MLKVVGDDVAVEHETLDAPGTLDLDEICRVAARQMLAVALEAERRAWLEQHADLVDESGRRFVVGNGYLPQRTIVTGAGEVEVKAPRVHDRRREDERQRYASSILPPYLRRSPKVAEVLPMLYLRGLSTGDFAPALETFSAPTQACQPPPCSG